MGSNNNTPAIKGSVGKLKSTSEFMPNSFKVTARGVKKTMEKINVSKEKKANNNNKIKTGTKQ